MQIVDQSHQTLTRINTDEVYKFLESCGRVAYKSEDKMTQDSAEQFLKSIIARGHDSVLEHFNISVLFVTDRGVTHELVRHRLCAYTQESTRYCNYSKKGMTFVKPVFWGLGDKSECYGTWLAAIEECEANYNRLINKGASPQEARTVLPNSLKTEIVCTANVREWRHILRLRTAKTAYPQMRALMIPLLKELTALLPVLFGDIWEALVGKNESVPQV